MTHDTDALTPAAPVSPAPAPALGDASRPSLSGRAFAALFSASSARAARPYPPDGNTGGNLRHPSLENTENPTNAGKTYRDGWDFDAEDAAFRVPDDTEYPPPRPRNTPPRKSRAKRTAPGLQALLDSFFFDWLTLTAMNPATGKGSRRPDADRAGRVQDEAVAAAWYFRACQWAVAEGLHQSRVGRGTDGYRAGAVLVAAPGSPERAASIRAGHSTNMPGIEIPGGHGLASRLAPSALKHLAPVLVARADAALDISHPGLLDSLIDYAREQAGQGAGRGMEPPSIIEKDGARTMYWGRDAVRVRVYQKDLERLAKGEIDPADADPDLVRVEFIFRPPTEKKAGFSELTPGEMVKTSAWARRMVEHLGRVIGVASKEDVMAKQTVRDTPDPRTYEDRALAGLNAYARTLCGAAAARLVARRFGGNWEHAEILPEAIENEVAAMVREVLGRRGAAVRFVEDNGLAQVQTGDARAADMMGLLHKFLQDSREKEAQAQAALRAALDRAGVKDAAAGQDGAGKPSSGSGGGSGGAVAGAAGAAGAA